jgi:hypothetical protein
MYQKKLKKRDYGKTAPGNGIYDPSFCEQAKKLCLLGAIDADIAYFFGVTEMAINNWKKEHPEFLQALREGKEIADAEIGEALFQRAKGYSHPEDQIFQFQGSPLVVPTIKHYPPDSTALIFWLKNRRPDKWRDKAEVDNTHHYPDSIEVKFT